MPSKINKKKFTLRNNKAKLQTTETKEEILKITTENHRLL